LTVIPLTWLVAPACPDNVPSASNINVPIPSGANLI